MMVFDARPPSNAKINDIEAINEIITHPAIYGGAGRISDVEDRLIVTVPGIAVCFRHIEGRSHECHQAVAPAFRGKPAITFMRLLATWWWSTQPSDVVYGPVPDNRPLARFTMHALGFRRDYSCDAPCIDGVVRPHIIYRLDRPA